MIGNNVGMFFSQAQACLPESLPWMANKKFTRIENMEHLRAELDKAIEHGLCALDLETQGLDNRIDENGRTFQQIVGYCFAYNSDEGFYVPVRHVTEDGRLLDCNLPYLEVDQAFRKACAECVMIYHNSTFDQEFLYGNSAHTPDPPVKMFEDTLILDYLKDSTAKMHGLKYLSKSYLGYEMHELKEFFPKSVKDRSFATLDPREKAVLEYAGSDAICTFMLYQYLEEYKTEQAITYEVEKALVPALRWTERNRMKVDLKYAVNLQTEVDLMITEVQDEIYATLADSLNMYDAELRKVCDINSPKQLGASLAHLQNVDTEFAKVELEETSEGSGQIKTDNATMEMLASEYGTKFPFLAKIQKMRSLQKVLGTYIKPIVENTRREDHTIRFSFQANRVDTGRFAASKGVPDQGYSGINVQSIPATYSYAKFYVKTVHSRPEGPGEENAELDASLQKALDTGFLRRIYDNHFMQDHRTGEELCVRYSCEGCPFASECEHSEPEKKLYYSVENAIRPALVARDGYVLVAIDYSGLELRAVANICEEPLWIREFYRCGSCGHEFKMPEKISRGKWKIHETPPNLCPTCGSDKIGDLHTLTAQIIYGDDVVNLPPSEFKQKRQIAKAVNFAIIYGGGGGAIARATGVPSKEGWGIRNKILNGLPIFNKWMETVIHNAHQNYEVETAIGRKIRLWDINSEEDWLRAKQERNAVNSIVQGSATGDLIKYAMASVYRSVRERQWEDVCRLCLTIHDELVFEIRQDMLDEVLPVIDGCMTEFAPKMGWAIPLVTDVEFNTNWSPNYNWTLMHAISPNDGLAEDGTPTFLLGKIAMTPGMWYQNKEGKHVWNGEEYVSEEEFKAQPPTAEDAQMNLFTGGQGPVEPEEVSEVEEPKAPVVRFPYYDYTTTIALGNSETLASYMLRLRRVIESCKVMSKLGYGKATHTLRVFTIHQDELTDPGKVIEVNPEIFKILAFHEGL